MAAPAAPSSPSGAGRLRLAWVPVLIAMAAAIIWDAAQTRRHYTRLSANYGVAVHAPTPDPDSPTGYAGGVRHLAYPSRWVDGQHWIMHTQAMQTDGPARLRQVVEDNAPAGRAVHWSSAYRWWLALVDQVAPSDEPSGGATVERSALLANPLLLLALLLGTVPWIAARHGNAAAIVFTLAFGASPAVRNLFAPDNPDHHGLIELCAVLALLEIIRAGGGWVRRENPAATSAPDWLPSLQQARRAMTGCALVGAAGLWISAATTLPLLAGLATGGVASAWLGRRASGSAVFIPDLWRRWGLAGGLGSLGFYLLEYFPHHLGWRLEVNHPLHALAWIGAGEIVAQITARWHPAAASRPRGTVLRLVLASVAAILPAAVILGAGPRVFVVSDPFLWRLSHDYTPEFQGLLASLRATGADFTTLASCLPLLLLPAALAWLARPAVPAGVRAIAVLPLFAATVFAAMALKELRWLPASLGLLPVALVALAPTLATRGQRVAAGLLLVALLGPGVIETGAALGRVRHLSEDDFHSLAERDLAHSLRQRVGDQPLVVLAAPATTSRLLYFGGARGLGTPYWENLAGLKRAAAILAASSADEARALVQAAGVTHLVFLPWDDFTEAYVRLARGLPPGTPLGAPAFGLELTRHGIVPPWLRLVPDHLPELPLFQNRRALIFEVTERTRPEQALVRAVRDQLYYGQLEAALSHAAELENHPRDAAAQIALARLRLATRDPARFQAALARLDALPDFSASLEPEDRLDRIGLEVAAGRAANARAQVQSALRDFDDHALRRLTPASLRNLVGLANRFELPWPDESRRALALRLLPPDGRR